MESKVRGSDSGRSEQSSEQTSNRRVRNRYAGSGPDGPAAEPLGEKGGRKGKPKGFKAFLTPGWAISAVAIVVFSYSAITMLAPWQLNKDDDITNRNHQIQEGFDREVVPYSELFNASGEVAPDNEWYRVSLTGQYLPEHEVLLRLRPVETTPAFQSLTPFELEDGRVVLVHRGFETSQGTIVPEMAAAPSTPLTIVGFARGNEGFPGTAPLEDSGYKQVYGINTEQVGEVTGLDLGEDYVQLAENEPGVLRSMPIPQLDRGSHLSYGFQWIAFGIMAPLGLGYFIWAEMRERRRDKAERAEMAKQDAVDADEPELTVDGAAAENTVPGGQPTAAAAAAASSQRRRSRYGDQHPDHYEHFVQRNEERF